MKSILADDSPIDLYFYYDVSSMYSYFAFKILQRYTDTLWKGLINWHLEPAAVGFIFKATNNSPPSLNKSKGPYVIRDAVRMSTYVGIDFKLPQALRCLTAIKMKMPSELINTTDALFAAYWGKGEDLSVREIVDKYVTKTLGEEKGKEILVIAESEEIKNKLKETTDKSIQLGAFGVPTIFIPRIQIPQTKFNSLYESSPDGYEMFFGADRLFLVAEVLGLPWFGQHPQKFSTSSL